MPAGTVATGYNADGTMFIQVNATGFTPGSGRSFSFAYRLPRAG
jgi:hypothetical protein